MLSLKRTSDSQTKTWVDTLRRELFDRQSLEWFPEQDEDEDQLSDMAVSPSEDEVDSLKVETSIKSLDALTLRDSIEINRERSNSGGKVRPMMQRGTSIQRLAAKLVTFTLTNRQDTRGKKVTSGSMGGHLAGNNGSDADLENEEVRALSNDTDSFEEIDWNREDKDFGEEKDGTPDKEWEIIGKTSRDTKRQDKKTPMRPRSLLRNLSYGLKKTQREVSDRSLEQDTTRSGGSRKQLNATDTSPSESCEALLGPKLSNSETGSQRLRNSSARPTRTGAETSSIPRLSESLAVPAFPKAETVDQLFNPYAEVVLRVHPDDHYRVVDAELRRKGRFLSPPARDQTYRIAPGAENHIYGPVESFCRKRAHETGDRDWMGTWIGLRDGVGFYYQWVPYNIPSGF